MTTTKVDAKKALTKLATRPAVPELSETERIVVVHRKLIRKAMKMGHGLETISRELQIPKRTLQRHLNEIGLFFRKPRAKIGKAVKRNLTAIARAKSAVTRNV